MPLGAQVRKTHHADVRPRAEVTLNALPGLVHLRITRLIGILGGSGHVNDRSVHDRACTPSQALMPQAGTDCPRLLRAQRIGIQQRRRSWIVVSSGMHFTLLMPANRCITAVSYSASSIVGLLSAYHCCRKWMRAIVASG